MSRYEQRRRKFLQDPEVARDIEMAAEFQLVQAIESIRSKLGISKEQLAGQIKRERLYYDYLPAQTLTQHLRL